jgi:hypothetical protein
MCLFTVPFSWNLTYMMFVYILWHIDTLLGNDCKINSFTMTVTKYWLCIQQSLLSNDLKTRNNIRIVGSGVFSVVGAIGAEAALRRESWEGSEKNRRAVWCGRHFGSYLIESQNLEQGVSCGSVASRWELEHGNKEHCWEPSPGNDCWRPRTLHSVVNCSVCELAMTL